MCTVTDWTIVSDGIEKAVVSGEDHRLTPGGWKPSHSPRVGFEPVPDGETVPARRP